MRCGLAGYIIKYVRNGFDPIPGEDFERHQIIRIFFSGGYVVFVGFRVRSELLTQVISLCPGMYRLLWYEYEYQHDNKKLEHGATPSINLSGHVMKV